MSGVTILPLHSSPSPATSHNQPPLASPSPILSNTWPTHETRRAPALNCVSPSGLKVCTDQLAPIFTLTLNRSMELYAVPCCLQETPYKLVKCCRAVILVLTYLQDITTCRRSTSGVDLLQFAFQSNRSVDNTINMSTLDPANPRLQTHHTLYTTCSNSCPLVGATEHCIPKQPDICVYIIQ